jgi:hypothetical protein
MLVGFILTPYATSRIGKVRSAVVTKLISAPFVVLMAFTKDFMVAAGAYVVYMGHALSSPSAIMSSALCVHKFLQIQALR